MSEMGGLGDLDLDSNPDSEYNLKDFEKSQIDDVPMDKDLDDVGVPTDQPKQFIRKRTLTSATKRGSVISAMASKREKAIDEESGEDSPKSVVN